jgi:hypothetical protein
VHGQPLFVWEIGNQDSFSFSILLIDCGVGGGGVQLRSALLILLFPCSSLSDNGPHLILIFSRTYCQRGAVTYQLSHYFIGSNFLIFTGGWHRGPRMVDGC